MKLLRVLRGVVGTAVTWGLAWIPLTAGFYGVIDVIGPGLPFRFWSTLVFGAAFRGAISGAVFGGLLSLIARRRSFSELTFPQLMSCGAAGAIIAPGVTLALGGLVTHLAIPPAAIAFSLMMSAGMGIASAAGTLYVARRAPEVRDADEVAIDAAPTPQAIR